MSQFIEVKKFDLKEGEELMDVVRNIQISLARHREKTNKSVYLQGIFKGFIITRDFENGRHFKMTLKRDKEGDIELGESIEVRQVFVPVDQKKEKAEGEDHTPQAETIEAMIELANDDTAPTYHKIEKVEEKHSVWNGLVR